MSGQQGPGPIARGEWLVLVAVMALFILLRLPLLTDPGLHLGWNSDAAIFGFMAQAIYAGRDFPIFFWGQSYMGPLTSLVAAAAGFALHPFGVAPAVGPLALRIAAAVEVLAGLLFYWAALRRAFDRATAMIVVVWLAIGPAYLFFFTIAPIGAEQMFLLSAILFWVAVRTELARPRQWFAFGLLSGIGWWINQGVVFVIAAALGVVILRSRAWAVAWPQPQILDRFLLRARRLRWRDVDRLVVLSIRAINIVLIVWIVDGALFAAGLPLPAFFLAEPLVEPVVAFMLFHLVVELIFGRDLRDACALLAQDWRAWLVPAMLFACGAVAGYTPVIAGAFLKLYPPSYGLSVPALPLAGMAGHVMTALRSDFWGFIGSSGEPAAALVAVGIVPLFAAGVLRNRNRLRDLLTLRAADYGPRGMAAATMILCTLFYVSSSRAHPGSMRYIVSALPMLYAFAAREMWRLRPRALAFAAALIVSFGLALPRIEQAHRVANGAGEAYSSLPGGFDPRPVLHAIESQGYSICYADYWIGYKLQWVSDNRVRFVPFHSYDRTPATSRALEAAPGPKCYVDGDGRVRPFKRSEFDESTMRAARQRLMRMRAEQQ